MKLSLFLPIALIIFSNVFYNICAKEIPKGINPFASLIVTYIIGAFASLVCYYIFNKNGNLISELKNINWSSFVLGLSIVGLEAGCIYMYKVGWNVSSGQLIASIGISICLIFVGALLYHEQISITKIVGIIVCLVGLFLINK